MYCSLTTLPIDVQSNSMLRIKDVPDAQVVEFPATKPGLKLDREQGLLASVVCSVDLGATSYSHLRRSRSDGTGSKSLLVVVGIHARLSVVSSRLRRYRPNERSAVR
jgi:hypothetical protein